jgi:hypothetical protein
MPRPAHTREVAPELPLDKILTAAANRPETYPLVRAAAFACAADPSRVNKLRLWRTYVLALSPAIAAYEWPEATRGKPNALANFDERIDAMKDWIPGGCVCGCGGYAERDGKVVHRRHYIIAWRRLCRVLLAEWPTSAMPWPAIALAHSAPRALLSDDEFGAISCLYFSDHVLP